MSDEQDDDDLREQLSLRCDNQDDRAAAILSEAAELSQPPTAAEVLEHEARSRANRLAEALAPLPRVPRYEPEVIHKRRDNALQVDAERAGSLLGRQPAGKGTARAILSVDLFRAISNPPFEDGRAGLRSQSTTHQRASRRGRTMIRNRVSMMVPMMIELEMMINLIRNKRSPDSDELVAPSVRPQ